jgi:hypothetical protein
VDGQSTASLTPPYPCSRPSSHPFHTSAHPLLDVAITSPPSFPLSCCLLRTLIRQSSWRRRRLLLDLYILDSNATFDLAPITNPNPLDDGGNTRRSCSGPYPDLPGGPLNSHPANCDQNPDHHPGAGAQGSSQLSTPTPHQDPTNHILSRSVTSIINQTHITATAVLSSSSPSSSTI